jgi:hypothetical protein
MWLPLFQSSTRYCEIMYDNNWMEVNNMGEISPDTSSRTLQLQSPETLRLERGDMYTRAIYSYFTGFLYILVSLHDSMGCY